MDCKHTAAILASQLAKLLTLIFIGLTLISAFVRSVDAMADTPSIRASDVLERAKDYQVKFRSGQFDVMPEYVAMLEEANHAQPDNADLWCALGNAYLAQAARAMMPGGNLANVMPAMQKGPAALKQALRLNPNHPQALARLGGVQAMMASFMNAPQMAASGVAQMNRAVELAPNSVEVRLQRAFSGLSLPDALRNHVTEGEDLDFLIAAADADLNAAGDYVRIMRGDLYFEQGDAKQAQSLYQTVGTLTSAAGVAAQSRLAALKQGDVPMSEIKSLRAAAGAQCAMCHSK